MTKEIKKAIKALDEKMNPKIEAVGKKLARLNMENLLVPDLIGPKGTNCEFANLKEWI